MITLQQTNYQTIQAMIRKHEELAAFYIEKAGAAVLESGRTEREEASSHTLLANEFNAAARYETLRAEFLKRELVIRRQEANAPAIEKAKG